MSTQDLPLFVVDGDEFRPQPVCRGPWDHALLHGSPITGLAGWAARRALGERADTLWMTRLTVDLLSAARLESFRIETDVVKAGRTTAVVDVTIIGGDRPVARASTAWGAAQPAADPRGVDPEQFLHYASPVDPTEHSEIVYPRPGFNCDAVELRARTGYADRAGGGHMWVRLASELIEGEPLDPFVRLATLADFSAAVGWDVSANGRNLINTDVTLQALRPMVGEWLMIDAETKSSALGVGWIEATWWDAHGPVARTSQSVVETAATLG